MQEIEAARIPWVKALTIDYTDMWESAQRVGSFYIASDYSKHALGFFQLASMAELAIVIRQTIIIYKDSLVANDSILNEDENRNVSERSRSKLYFFICLAFWSYEVKLWTVYTICSLELVLN